MLALPFEDRPNCWGTEAGRTPRGGRARLRGSPCRWTAAGGANQVVEVAVTLGLCGHEPRPRQEILAPARLVGEEEEALVPAVVEALAALAEPGQDDGAADRHRDLVVAQVVVRARGRADGEGRRV